MISKSDIIFYIGLGVFQYIFYISN